MSSTNKPNITLSTPFGAPPTSTDTAPSPTLDPTINGPSVYLYAFLASLVLIFSFSVCLAWRGYRARRVLRARIDDAIARGVLVPGYDPDNPTLPFFETTGYRGRGVPVPNRPVMFEEWIAGEGEGIVKVGDGRMTSQWEPTALDALKPYDPPPPLQPTPRLRTSPLSHLLGPLREYWFVQPRHGTDPNQLQGRPGRRGNRRGWADAIGHGHTDTVEEPEQEEKEVNLEGVQEARAGVLIAMPDRTHPRWGNSATGVGYPSGPGGYAAVSSGSRPSSWHPPQGAVASSSRPTTSSAVPPGHRTSASIGTAAAAAAVVEERRELPELVFGVVGFEIEEARVSNAVEGVGETRDENVEQMEGAALGKGKEVERGAQPGVVTL